VINKTIIMFRNRNKKLKILKLALLRFCLVLKKPKNLPKNLAYISKATSTALSVRQYGRLHVSDRLHAWLSSTCLFLALSVLD